MDDPRENWPMCQSPWHGDKPPRRAVSQCFADGEWRGWCDQCDGAAPYRLALPYGASLQGHLLGAIFEAEAHLVYLRQALEAYHCDMARLAGMAAALRDTGGPR